MRIDSSGNVGIGTTSLSAEFTVNNETDTTAYNGTATDGQLTAGATQLIRAAAGANTNVAQLVFQTRAAQPFNRIVSSGGTAPFMAFATNDAERMRISSAGLVTLSSGSGLSISATAVTSPAASDGNVFSGTYTPTQVSTNTNVTAVTYNLASYMRVGSIVTVSGRVDITATATGNTIVQFSLPIASAFAATSQGSGTGAHTSATVANNAFARLSAQATDDCILLQTNSTVLTSASYFYTFTYRIL
jgi:maltoporin